MTARVALCAALLGLFTALSATAQRGLEAPRIRDEPRPANAGLPRVDRLTPLVRMVEAVSPAVVNISTERLQKNPYYRSGLFDLLFNGGEAPSRFVENSLGSGVIVDPRGYVVTNEHVLAAASRIQVTLIDGRQVAAEFIGSAADYDLAVLKLADDGPWPYLSVEVDDDMHPGETVAVIGNPFGHESTVTTGILSGLRRQVETGGKRFTDFLQTDAAINPGNSGGALLNLNGDLIGIPTVVDARAQNIGFAIPVARVRKVLDEVLRFGEVQRVWLGMSAENLEGRLSRRELERLGLPNGKGLLVTRVWDDLPADRAGLKPGDVVVSIDGAEAGTPTDFETALSRIRLGDLFRMKVWREGSLREIECRAEPVPIERGAEYLRRLAGLECAERRDGFGRRLVVIEKVVPGSPAAEVGLVEGLALLRVGDVQPESLDDVHEELFRNLGRAVLWLVVSDGRDAYRVKLTL